MKRVIRLFSIAVFSLSGFLSGTYGQSGNKIIQLGTSREIFVDNYLIDQLTGTRIIMHTPHDEGIVMYFDKPWEGSFCGYCTIIKEGDSFRAYYRGVPESGKDGNSKEVTCYAESKDGIHWVKPALKIHNIIGSLDNNVILANEAPATHNFSPFLDTNPDARPDQKYKGFGGTEISGLIAFASPDGIHWKRMKEEGVYHKGVFDYQNVSFWSEREKCYVCYFRTWSGGGYNGFGLSAELLQLII
jgi:hypothetical protein